MKDHCIRNTLYLLAPDSGASAEFCQGVVTATMSIILDRLQWTGSLPYSQAWSQLVAMLPKNFRMECIPPHWQKVVGSKQ